MSDPTTPHDPKGLIREAFRIDGIGVAECRSIFLDWAVSLPDGADQVAAAAHLLTLFGEGAPAHPMTQVLSEARHADGRPTRRGGASARRQVP